MKALAEDIFGFPLDQVNAKPTHIIHHHILILKILSL